MPEHLSEGHPEDPERQKRSEPAGSGKPYEVGFGKPPKATQFKPGRSGNPKGRPKGRPNNRTILEEIASKQLTVIENGRRQKKPLIAVGYERLGERVAKGDLRALVLFVKEMERMGLGGDADDESANALTPAEEALLRRHLGMNVPEEGGE